MVKDPFIDSTASAAAHDEVVFMMQNINICRSNLVIAESQKERGQGMNLLNVSSSLSYARDAWSCVPSEVGL